MGCEEAEAEKGVAWRRGLFPLLLFLFLFFPQWEMLRWD